MVLNDEYIIILSNLVHFFSRVHDGFSPPRRIPRVRTRCQSKALVVSSLLKQHSRTVNKNSLGSAVLIFRNGAHQICTFWLSYVPNIKSHPSLIISTQVPLKQHCRAGNTVSISPVAMAFKGTNENRSSESHDLG